MHLNVNVNALKMYLEHFTHYGNNPLPNLSLSVPRVHREHVVPTACWAATCCRRDVAWPLSFTRVLLSHPDALSGSQDLALIDLTWIVPMSFNQYSEKYRAFVANPSHVVMKLHL